MFKNILPPGQWRKDKEYKALGALEVRLMEEYADYAIREFYFSADSNGFHLKWIKASDITPKHKQLVSIAHDVDKWTAVGSYDNEKGHWFDLLDSDCPVYPTHWFPIPNPL